MSSCRRWPVKLRTRRRSRWEVADNVRLLRANAALRGDVDQLKVEARVQSKTVQRLEAVVKSSAVLVLSRRSPSSPERATSPIPQWSSSELQRLRGVSSRDRGSKPRRRTSRATVASPAEATVTQSGLTSAAALTAASSAASQLARQTVRDQAALSEMSERLRRSARTELEQRESVAHLERRVRELVSAQRRSEVDVGVHSSPSRRGARSQSPPSRTLPVRESSGVVSDSELMRELGGDRGREVSAMASSEGESVLRRRCADLEERLERAQRASARAVAFEGDASDVRAMFSQLEEVNAIGRELRQQLAQAADRELRVWRRVEQLRRLVRVRERW